MIKTSIQMGTLSANDALPSQRWLAAKLNVDLTTVTRAYTEARNRGLLASFGGRGSYVLGLATDRAQAHIDLAMNTPPQPTDRSLAAEIQAGLNAILARPDTTLLSRYPSGTLSPSAKQAAQRWLQPALGAINYEPVLLCEGAQSAIFGILLAHTQRGDTVLCESLTYPGFMHAARQLGLRVQALESDADGVLPDALARAHRDTQATLLYLNPTLHNPTARTMPASRRGELANVLSQTTMILIEDDPYHYLLADAPPPITTFTRGRNSYYLASFSKCVSPSLRSAVVLAPDLAAQSRLHDSLRAASMGSSSLLGALTEHWIHRGIAQQLVQAVQREARARQTLARALLPANAYAHPTGIHVWLPLPAAWSPQRFAHTLEASGIYVASADAFSVEASAPHAVRLSLGGASDHAALAQALRTINALITQPPARRSSAIV